MIFNEMSNLPFGEMIQKYAVNAAVTYGRAETTRRPAKPLDGQVAVELETHISSNTPPRFLLRLPEFVAWRQGAAVYQPHGDLIFSEYVDFQQWNHPVFKWNERIGPLRVPNPTHRVSGKTLYLSSVWGDTFYHFHADVLGKLYNLLNWLDVSYFDQVVIHPNVRNYIKDWFAIIAPTQNYICEPSDPTIYEELYIPSYYHATAHISRELMDFLGGLRPYKNKTANQKLYISRSKANWRRIANEHELKEGLEKRNFKIVCMEDYASADQQKLVTNSNLVVAPHGAGLTNLMFANPETKVIEIFGRDYINSCFYELACERQLQYLYFLVDNIGDAKPHRDLYVESAKFFRLIDEILP
jgi:capsular polysaccharide biosynthesis protein